MNPTEIVKSLAWERPLSKPINRHPKPMKITLKFIWEMLPAIWRIRRWTREQRRLGRRPLFNLVRSGFPITPDKGVPLGGLGGGTITRGCRGDFNRWALKPGDYAYRKVEVDQFSLRVARQGEAAHALVLNPDPPKDKALQHWEWGLDEAKITYRALFPRAWHDYDSPISGINLYCRQVSPVIPHNYRESSFPVSTFVWRVENTAEKDTEVTLMFHLPERHGG